MPTKVFLDYAFSLIEEIILLKDENGKVLEEFPQARYKDPTAALNKYGVGPYCRFRVAKGFKEAGIYIICSDDVPLYVGETANLDKRYSSNGYGGISPKNCYVGGQETNCRINNLVLVYVKKNVRLNLWFYPMIGSLKQERIYVERKLISSLKPVWNR